MKYLLYIISALLVAVPAQAAYHNYTCSDTSLVYAGVSWTCSSTNVFSFPGGGAGSVSDKGTPQYWAVSNSTNYYITYNASRNGIGPFDGRFYFNGDGGSSSNLLYTSGQQNEVLLNSGTVNPNAGLIWYASTAVTLTGICVDDDGVSCTNPPSAAIKPLIISQMLF